MKNQYLLFTVFDENQYLSAGKKNPTCQVESLWLPRSARSIPSFKAAYSVTMNIFQKHFFLNHLQK